MSSITDPQRLVELIAHRLAHDASESAARRPSTEDEAPSEEEQER